MGSSPNLITKVKVFTRLLNYDTIIYGREAGNSGFYSLRALLVIEYYILGQVIEYILCLTCIYLLDQFIGILCNIGGRRILDTQSSDQVIRIIKIWVQSNHVPE